MRVTIFGLFGSGNLGNDGSLDAMLRYLRAEHPEAELTCVCVGPEATERQYGIPAIPMFWYQRHRVADGSRPASIALKAFGKVADAVRTAWWVRRADVVIVPGMGVLEATLPIRPWGFPYALFLVSLWGRLLGTKVALVSVGASATQQPGTQWVLKQIARLAHYRSYRDAASREALRSIGVDTSRDSVYPDLAFALDEKTAAVDRNTVGVGVMAYYGTYLDRRDADAIHEAYLAELTEFVRWLVDDGREVRLFGGDPADELVVRRLVEEFSDGRVLGVDTATFDELTEHMSSVEVVVASRYHNVLSALKLAKPTISISYATKNDMLMKEMGLGEFCQPIRELDAQRLIQQFRALEDRRHEVPHLLRDGTERNRRLLAEQNAVLTRTLFSTSAGIRAGCG